MSTSRGSSEGYKGSRMQKRMYQSRSSSGSSSRHGNGAVSTGITSSSRSGARSLPRSRVRIWLFVWINSDCLLSLLSNTIYSRNTFILFSFITIVEIHSLSICKCRLFISCHFVYGHIKRRDNNLPVFNSGCGHRPYYTVSENKMWQMSWT